MNKTAVKKRTFLIELRESSFHGKFEVWAVQKYVSPVDIVKSFPASSYYLVIVKIGVDTTEWEPPKLQK